MMCPVLEVTDDTQIIRLTKRNEHLECGKKRGNIKTQTSIRCITAFFFSNFLPKEHGQLLSKEKIGNMFRFLCAISFIRIIRKNV